MNVLTRRAALASMAALMPTLVSARTLTKTTPSIDQQFSALEAAHGGRLGVAVLDTQTGKSFGHRQHERFAMCSTFKLILAAAILHRVEQGTEHLDRMVPYSQADLLEYAPVTRAHVSDGAMNVSALCDAAVTLSDNTAANLLLASIGGPTGWTGYVRTLGDTVSQLDRNEPALNTATPGDPRDTTTPAAMLADMNKVLLGNVLPEPVRDQMKRWMIDCKTADTKIRAGLPAGWHAGNKTGSGDNGSTNDIAIIVRPGRAPILVTAYYTGSTAPAAARNGVLASVGRIVASAV